jgi:hypothetical protein
MSAVTIKVLATAAPRATNTCTVSPQGTYVGDAEELGVSLGESTATCNTPQRFLIAFNTLKHAGVRVYTNTYFTIRNLQILFWFWRQLQLFHKIYMTFVNKMQCVYCAVGTESFSLTT